MTMRRSNFFVGGFMLTVSVLLFLDTFTFEGRPIARLFPQAVLVSMIIFSTILILEELIKRTSSQIKARGNILPVTTLFGMGVAFIYIYVSFILGFYATTVFVLTALPFTLGYIMQARGGGQRDTRRWYIVLGRHFLVAAGFSITIYFAFTYMLKIRFSEGLLF